MMSEISPDTAGEVTTETVKKTLREVLDPCSCHTDNPVNIVELGIVDKIEVMDGRVHIELLPTSPVCMYVANIKQDIQTRVGNITGVKDVTVEQITDVWTPDRMAPKLQEARRQQFDQRVESEGIMPYAERAENQSN